MINSLVTKEEVEGVPEAFVLHNVLTPEECDFYINFTEKLGRFAFLSFDFFKKTTSFFVLILIYGIYYYYYY